MTELLEEPLYCLMLGVPVTIGLAVMWLRTGQRAWVLAAATAALITGGLLLAEWLVVTDREMITQVIEQIRLDVESNDVDRIVTHVHPSRADTIARVRAEFPDYEIHGVSITKIFRIDVDRSQDPPTAEVELNASVLVSFREFDQQSFLRYVWVKFRQDGDQWKIADYRHDQPMRGFLKDEG